MSLSASDSTLPFEIGSRRSILFLLFSIPLLFGATHPFIQGIYTLYILVGAGGWFLFVVQGSRSRFSRRRRSSRSRSEESAPAAQKTDFVPTSFFVRLRQVFSPWLWPGLILLFYIGLTTLPLPLGLLDMFTPVRGGYLEAVNRLAGAAVTSAPLSYSGLLTFKQGAFYLALLFYFVSASLLLRRNRDFAIQVVTIMVAIGCFEALYGLLQAMNSSLGVLWLPSDIGAQGVARGTIIYRNQYASLLNMCWPLAVAVAALKIKKHPPPVFLFGAGLMILAVLFSLSRGGTIALFLVAIVISWTMPFSRRRKLITLAILLLFLAVYGGLLGGYGDLIKRFTAFQSGLSERMTVWRLSLPMLFDHPLTGIGLESYIKLSPLYLKNFPSHMIWDRAHNEYLELAIEIGWPAMVLFFGWLVSGLAVHGRRLFKQRDAILGIAAFAGIISFFIHGACDFGWHLPANCVYCLTLMALVSAELHRYSSTGRKRKK